MPLLFKQSSSGHSGHHHQSYGHLPSVASNNNDISSFSNNARTNSNNYQQAGNLLRRYSREISSFQCNPQTFLKLFKKYYQKWHLKHLLPLVFVTIYMFIGAVLFLWLEESAETKRILKR